MALSTTYMLARLKLKYGASNLARYNEAMKSIREFFENEGVMLQHALVTSVGPLYEVLNLWAIEDPNHFARAVSTLGDERVHAKYAATLAVMQEIVLEEELSLLETMPFFTELPPAAALA